MTTEQRPSSNALLIVGRTDEAMTRAKAGYAHLDPRWPDAEKLRNNYATVINDRLCTLIEGKDYRKAVEVYVANFPWGKYVHGDKGADVCIDDGTLVDCVIESS